LLFSDIIDYIEIKTRLNCVIKFGSEPDETKDLFDFKIGDQEVPGLIFGSFSSHKSNLIKTNNIIDNINILNCLGFSIVKENIEGPRKTVTQEA
jgi:hypothetical protein